jgi:protoporphyrinogen oxidase
MSELEKKCIIIGAGPAGLTAAYELLKSPSAHVHPVIYEASEEIGGISKTVEYKGNRIDIGGHRFFTKNEDVMALWHEVMPAQGAPSKDDILLKRDVPLSPNGPDPEKTDRVMLSRHRISRIFYLHKFFDYPISIKLQTFKNMGVVRTWKAGWGYLGSCLHKRKETSLADFYMNRFGKPLYKMFFEDYTEKVWGRNPSQIAPDWGSQRVKGLSLWKTFTNALAKPFRKKSKNVETSLIEQFDYPKKGPGQLYEEMASLIKEMGGEIHLGSEVTKLNLQDGKVVSIVINGKTWWKGITSFPRCRSKIFISPSARKMSLQNLSKWRPIWSIAISSRSDCWPRSCSFRTKPKTRRFRTSFRTPGSTFRNGKSNSAGFRSSTIGLLIW